MKCMLQLIRTEKYMDVDTYTDNILFPYRMKGAQQRFPLGIPFR